MLAEFELSMRRAPKRRLVLLMLASLTEATPRALAQACGIDAQRLHGIMFGDEENQKYSVELALGTLDLAALETRDKRRIYVITERGRKKARQLTARSARQAAAREVNRKRTFAPVEVREISAYARPAAMPAPVATHSFGWSVTCGRTCADTHVPFLTRAPASLAE